jgi:hypothetical protein
VTHVDRVHAPGSGLEQAVGEASGGGADVDADELVDAELEHLECSGQLVTTP